MSCSTLRFGTAISFLAAFIGAQRTCDAADGEAGKWTSGSFQNIAEPLAVIFNFNIDDGQLVLDRDAWNVAAEAIEKKDEEAAKLDPNKLPRGIQANTPQAL